MYHGLLYQFVYRHQLQITTTIRLNGFELTIKPTVQHPKIFRSGEVFAKYLSSMDFQGKKVLDMGTGSGVLALTTAARGANVTATDINPTAVDCAAENFRRNGFESKVKTLEGHLFNPIKEMDFDVIVCNPPFLTQRSSTIHDMALFGGDKLSLLREFASFARSYLKPNGIVLLLVSTDSDIELVLNIFREHNYHELLMHNVKNLFEDFYIYKFVPKATDNKNVGFACPSCHGNLALSQNRWTCEKELLSFDIDNGIPDFLLPSRYDEVAKFLEVYHAVRKNEGWGNENPEYYHLLPYVDTTGRHKNIWKIRSKTFQAFLLDISRDHAETKTILDLGAGNCWLSNRLVRKGFEVTAVDLSTDRYDGLGVAQRIGSNGNVEFACIRAEFDHLPFQQETFDVIIFNASLHYSKDPYGTLTNMQYFLKKDGTIYVLDSPIYRDESSGYAMLRERQDDVKLRVGLDLPEEFSGSFLTYHRLGQLENKFSVEFVAPDYGLKWSTRKLISFLLNKREPASFEIIKLTKR